jgi:hypothetical protein
MKLFICCRNIEKEFATQIVNDLLNVSKNSIAILQQFEHSDNWKSLVQSKFKESDFIMFLVGAETFKSEQILWEYAKAKDLNKQIVGIRLSSATEESILFCQGFQVFKNADDSFDFLKEVYKNDRLLKIEQYKLMVSSTEKVTDSRSKVNSLFFTITSTILSISFIVIKNYEFRIVSIGATIILTLLAFTTTFFWSKLVVSYGKLNTGKFKLIDRLEKELRTNMFEEEWKILTNEIRYQSNTKTETEVITAFRIFIIGLLIVEVFYLIYSVSLNYC